MGSSDKDLISSSFKHVFNISNKGVDVTTRKIIGGTIGTIEKLNSQIEKLS